MIISQSISNRTPNDQEITTPNFVIYIVPNCKVSSVCHARGVNGSTEIGMRIRPQLLVANEEQMCLP
jgi:hypothetical protein